MSLSGPFRAPVSGAAPQSLMVILHGWGADGANLIDLADFFAADFPHTHFIAPNAPEVCEVNPYGYQWFSLQNRQPEVLNAGVRHAADSLNRYLDEKLTELGLDESKLVLGGFSQGTMLALQVALRRATAVAGLVGYSGALLDVESLKAEIQSKPPVCLIHGQMDDIVPFDAMRMAEMVLTQHAVPLETHARPYLGHSIDMEGLAIAKQFLKGKLA